MSKKGKLCLALFLALALIVQYSFAPQGFIAYADDEVTAASTEQAGSDDQTQKDEPKSDPKPEASAPADSGDQGAPSNNDADSGDDSDSGDATTGDNEAVGETDDPDVVPGEGDVIDDPVEGVVEEEEGVEYPEVTLHANAGGVTVTLHAPEGALPEGAKLSASRVDSQAIFNAVEQKVEAHGMEMVDAVAIDVTPLDKDGHAVQPKKAVTVTFSGTGLEAGEDVDVFHVSDNAGSVSEMGASVASTNKQQFSTNHFSIYVAATTATNPVGDGSTTTKRYVLEYGEYVTIHTTTHGYRHEEWRVTGAEYIQEFVPSVGKVENHNETDHDGNVTIEFRYRDWSWQSWNHEYFYILTKPQKFDVTFNIQNPGESGFTPYGDPLKVYSGTTIEAPNPPEIEDYTFYGWYTDAECTQPATAADFRITKASDFYGKYTTDATIKYRKNTDDPATVPADVTSGVGIGVKLGDAERDGYSLQSWNTKQDGSGDSYQPGQTIPMPETGLVLYAQWSDAHMIIRYYLNDGSTDAWRSYTGIRKNSRTSITSEIPTRDPSYFPVVTYYLFRGWSTNSNARNPEYYPNSTYNTGDEDLVKLYAVWGRVSLNDLKSLSVKDVECTYDGEEHSITPDDIEGGMGTVTQQGATYIKVGDTAIFGNNIFAKVAFAEENQKNKDIKASGTDVGHYSTPISAELWYQEHLTGIMMRMTGAPYIEIDSGMLTIKPANILISTESAEKPYDHNPLTVGGTATINNDEGETVIEGDFSYGGTTVQLFKNDTVNIRTTGTQTEVGQSDNEFQFDWGKPDDWDNDLDAATAKRFNYNIVAPEEYGILTVYLGVAFDKNAGEDTVTNMPEDLKAYNEDTAKIPDNEPAREGYNYLGWAKTADAKQADYQPGHQLTLDEIGEGMTLYAVWEAIPEPTPTPTPTPVTPDAGGDGDGGGAAAAAGGAAAAAAAAPAAAGTTIDQAPTPTTINDNAAPKSANSSWALINLISALLTALLSLIMLIRYFGSRREENEETGEVADTRSGSSVRLASLIPAIGGIVAFVATENMAGQMGMTDKWTVMMVAILAIQAGVAAFAKVKDNYEIEDVE